MVEVRPLRLNDVPQMAHWGKHDDPRFLAYDFGGRTHLDFLSWFLVKRQPFRKWVYGVFLEERMIGYISYKNYDRHLRKGEMGISFDPDFLSRGYGTQALHAYLALVFKKFSIDRVWLKTALFNARAIRCYEKSGFIAYGRKKEPYEDQSAVLTLVNRWPAFFEYHDDLVWTEYVYMAVERRDFEK